MTKLKPLALALVLASAACSKGTYALVTFDKAPTTPAGVVELDLAMMLAGKSASATVKPGHEIMFPTTAAITIGSGSGAFTIDVTARDAGGAILDSGHGEGTIASGKTTDITVQLNGMPGGNGGGGGGGVAGGGGGGGGGSTGVLSVDKATVDFGTVVVNQMSGQQSITVSNTGTATSGTLTTALADSTNFTIVNDACNGMTLAAAATCAITVQMTPKSAGTLSTMITVSGTPGGSVASTLSGNAVMPGPITLAPTMHDFGSVVNGSTSTSYTFTATNGGTATTGALTIAIGGTDSNWFSVVTDHCTGMTLAPSATCSVDVVFGAQAQTPQGGARSATLTVMGMPGGVAVSNLSGTALRPVALSVSYTAGAFGSVTVGSSSNAVNVTVLNNGDVATTTMNAATITPGTDFFIASDACMGTTIAAHASCIVQVKFTPSTSGNLMATLSVSDTGGDVGNTTLTGMGLTPAALAIAPTTYDFGIVNVGSTATKTFTVSNTGMSPTGALQVRQSVGFPVSIANDGCTAMTLAANGTCTFDVVFAPTAYGPTSGTVQVSGSPGGTAATNLSGTGRDFVTLTINKSGTGSGTVTSTDTNINCGTVCSAQYARTSSTFTTVNLGATAAVGSLFAGFGGACMGSSCTVTMSQNQTVTATFNAKMITISIVTTAVGSIGSAQVSSSDGNIFCGGTCSHTYAYSTSTITLNESVTGGAFYGWSGAPCGNKPGCTVDLTQDRTITASFGTPPPAYVFVTSQPFLPSQINGLTGADSICNSRAMAAGLPGSYAAWLSDNTTSANTRVGPGGWLRTDGRPFTPNLTTLTGANHFTWYPPRIDENGNDVGDVLVFGGHNDTGQTFGGSNCTNWTTNSGGAYVGTSGGVGGFSGYWSYDQLDGAACSAGRHIYCMQKIPSQVNVTQPPPVPGTRFAFVSKATWTPGANGLAGADAVCQSDATAATLANPTSYLALLSTSGAPATARFNIGPGTPTYMRIDGTLLVAASGDLATSGTILAVPQQAADGSYQNSVDLWTGSPTPGVAGTATTTCADWTDSTSTGMLGYSDSTGDWWAFRGITTMCGQAGMHVWCLQK